MLASIFLFVVQLVLLLFSTISTVIIGRINITPIIFALSWVVGIIAVTNLYYFNPQVAALIASIELFIFGVFMILIIISQITKGY